MLAYLDPGYGSLLIQALVGGSAGLCVFARYVWQSIRYSSTIDKSAPQNH